MALRSLGRRSVLLLLFSVLTISILQLFFVNAEHYSLEHNPWIRIGIFLWASAVSHVLTFAGQEARMLGGRFHDLSPPPGPQPGRMRHMIPPEIPPKVQGSPPPPSH
ncbi:unnamed protein product [Dovyalis caffra]|uniref:Uncharacterized protein n=1 Tax=Dovyalis caffra TaxID=77055 RepID=A0AAV1R0U9_9ROSI|nr:unnamed protein product [Dovyalis caffra]